MMAAKAANLGPELMRYIEKSLLLQVLDAVWKEHLLAIDHLRQGIGLRAYGQRDPLNEYKSEAFGMFNAMLDELKERVTAMLARVELAPDAPPEPLGIMAGARRCSRAIPIRRWPAASWRWPRRSRCGSSAGPMRSEAVDPDNPATWAATPRNAPCPCGSGREIQALPRADGVAGQASPGGNARPAAPDAFRWRAGTPTTDGG